MCGRLPGNPASRHLWWHSGILRHQCGQTWSGTSAELTLMNGGRSNHKPGADSLGGVAAVVAHHWCVNAAFPHGPGNRLALRAAGLRQVRFHDQRHSFASNLLAAGVDVVTVSEALGHANPHITFTVYAHALPKERHGADDALDRRRKRLPSPDRIALVIESIRTERWQSG